MTRAGSLLLALTAIVGVLAGLTAFAVARFIAAAREMRRARPAGSETTFMAAAVEEAMTRLKQQERAMSLRAQTSERISGQIVANLTSGLLVVGADGTVQTLNPAGRRLLGMPDADWTRHFREVLGIATPLADVIDECLTGGQPIVRRAIRLDTGAASHVGVTVSPMREGDGPVQGAVCLFSDLSAVVELEEQLRLKDSLARLGELTAGLAHEFRNGLATIHGYARLLDPARLPDEARPYVTGLRAETEALTEVVTNFLNFARPAHLTLGPVEMRAIAERAAEEVRGEAASRGGWVRVEGEFDTILGDEVLLRQAFSNLCRNALEACTEAGRPPHIAIRGTADRAAGTLRLAVTDNGPGIDPALGDRVFQPFVTGRARGTGLGLALVQKIIVTHNGRVHVAASESGGAAFQITLPLANPGSSTPVT